MYKKYKFNISTMLKDMMKKFFNSPPAIIQKIPLKILVIGATGAGKSSLINLFYVWSNNLDPRKIGDLKEVLIQTKYLKGDGEAERSVNNQGQSQTFIPKLYEFELKVKKQNNQIIKVFQLSFLDTPGFGDTKGIAQDDQNVSLIINTVCKTQNLSAILLMMNGSDPRINTHLKYIIVRLQGMLPDILQQNIFYLLSNVDIQPNLDLNQGMDIKIDSKKIFYFNNQIFSVDPAKYREKKILDRLVRSYNQTLQNLIDLLEQIANCKVKPTRDFQKIKYGRDMLKKKLHQCNEKEIFIIKKKNQIQKILIEISKGNTQLAQLSQRLTYTQYEPDFVSQPTTYHNTTCMTCKNCCHQKCGLEMINVQGTSLFQNCLAFNGQTSCKNCHHDFRSHNHLRQIYRPTKKEVKKTDTKIQKHMKATEISNESKQKNICLAKQTQKKLDQDLDKLHDEIDEIVVSMQSVCSKFDYVKQIEACINILKEEIEYVTSNQAFNPTRSNQQTLVALQTTRDNMINLKKRIQKHIRQSKKTELKPDDLKLKRQKQKQLKQIEKKQKQTQLIRQFKDKILE